MVYALVFSASQSARMRRLRHFRRPLRVVRGCAPGVHPFATTRRVTLPGYTIVNLMELENKAAEGGSTTEARFARGPLDSEHIGLSHFRYAPERRSKSGHTHKEQEEVYLVLSGSGQVKLDDELVDLRALGCRPRRARNVPRLRGRPRRARDPRDRLGPAGRRRRRERRGRLVGRLGTTRSCRRSLRSRRTRSSA